MTITSSPLRSLMINPQLRRTLSKLKEEGSLFVLENCDPEDEYPGILMAEERGFVSHHLSQVGCYFEFTAAGRELMGIPPTFGDRMWRYLRSFGFSPRPTVKS
ncbi:hypothetical protein ACVIGV_000918 [Rhizobium leguminosarum]